ncbi:uncharacterized protein EV154DRAFT_537478 [Mucor mucedo]|uniref:uncharacterized protein n=1 Tax=Mucor mucedo TaxID=29922 RepID=UPI00221ECF4C|nr:uncharacterized protein EV154DRAFT_537478 [Mucor mucedo]KAI7892510.1 hypothetical protein EV154DRAFT_537478 [Mucor mucedo]
MICSRSLSVTSKKTGNAQKTIDSSLLRFDPITNQTSSISSRCADMDAELPLQLGVPKAILESVIFCHQEDSNWPFAESAVLKKKFDDIFDSRRYQSVLDNIKNVRKEKMNDVNIGNARLEGVKSDTLKAKKIRTNLTQMRQQLATKSESLLTVETKLERVQNDSGRLNDLFRTLNLTADQIQQVINKRDFFQSTLNSLETHITPRPESTEELQRMLNNHRSSQTATNQKKSQIHEDKAKLERQLNKARQDLAQKHTIMGRLDANREEYERLIRSREDMIEKINVEYGMDLPVDDGLKTAAVLKKDLGLKASKIEQAKSVAMTKQNALSDELQILKSKILSIQESKKYLMDRIQDEKIKIKGLNQKIERLQANPREMDEVKAKIEENNAKLRKLNEVARGGNRTEFIQKEHELRELDAQVSVLNEELSTLSKQGDIRAKLSIKRADKESKEADMTKLYQGRISDVERLLNSRPSIENIEKELQAFKKEKERMLRIVIERRNTTQRELSKTDGKLNMVRQNLVGRQREADKYSNMCKQVCGDRDVAEELKATESKIEEIKERLCHLSAVSSIYEKYIKGATDAKCCPLCVRGFNDEPELEEFSAKLQHKKQGFPVIQTQMEATLAKLDVRLTKLKSVQGAWIKLEQLKSDIAGIQATVDSLTAEKETATAKAEIAATEQAEVDDAKIKADRLLIVAGNVSRIYKEAQAASKEVQAIETELEFAGGSTRTITDCQRDLEQVSDKSKLVRRDLKRIQSDIDSSRLQAQMIEKTIRDHEKSLSELEQNINFKCGLEFQLEEYNETLAKHIDECKAVQLDVEPLNEKIAEATREFDQEVQSWKREEEEASNEERQMSRLVDRLDELNTSISRIEASMGRNKTDQVKKETQAIESLCESLKSQISDAVDRLSMIEKDEGDKRGIERDLEDQIRYRQTEKDLKQCDEDLAELERNQGEHNLNQMKRDLRRLEEEENILVDRRGSIRGEVTQLKDQINRYEGELSTDYQNIDGIYAKMFITVKTTELACIDLETYSKALETAIMKFHSLKMDDLNKVIKDLWYKTYKGGDIDHIAIRADNDNIAKNRSFNYRVVMNQNGNELDMRGRCSAGQKVLASIIIRLALAETFCVNCGFFALDEPTTNLDYQNIISLAENLKAIITSRKEQSNFQLLVITHDENFVGYLGGSGNFDQYYRVTKENG